jgi:hypothetical protein
MKGLIDYQHRHFSQSGEDGIIARVFEIIGVGNKLCCEFGAWDGIHLSNTRSLILDGWSALLIEGDIQRFHYLQTNYAGDPTISLECSFVGADGNSLAQILERHGLADLRLDLLSIDIDGLDFDHFSTLDRLRFLPRLVVVEVQPEHGPDRTELLPPVVARNNIGQPLAAFVAKGHQLGYRLICYFGGNAFFLARDVGGHALLPTISPAHAWQGWYETIHQSHADYLFMRNIGLNESGYRYDNEKLSASALGISIWRARRFYFKRFIRDIRHTIAMAMNVKGERVQANR